MENDSNPHPSSEEWAAKTFDEETKDK